MSLSVPFVIRGKFVDKDGHLTPEAIRMFQQTNDVVAGGVTGPASSVNNEIVLFSGTSGQILKAATGTGVVFATSGVYSVTAATDLGFPPQLGHARL